MRKTFFGLLLIAICSLTTHAQSTTLEGYVFEGGNQGYLNSVDIRIIETTSDRLIATTFTDQYGFFTTMLPINQTYVIRADKDLYQFEETTVSVQPSDAGQKVHTQIRMFRLADAFGNPKYTEKSGNLGTPSMMAVAESYGIDSKQIIPTANPEGVAFTDAISENDPYAAVTNATRLVDKNYNESSDREAMKYAKMPTAYKPTAKINLAQPITERAPNKHLTTPNQPMVPKEMSIPDPQFGETLVRSADDFARTRDIPAYYTGYKIEFITSFNELPANHEIFQRHGNITMERKSNGIYSYLLGDFMAADIGQKSLEESMLERYPSATLIAYENGKRINKRLLKKVKTKPVSPPPR